MSFFFIEIKEKKEEMTKDKVVYVYDQAAKIL